MPINPGARLGPYQIVSLLGRGGMGEVYRAVDTRVNRTVAVKVLPAEAAAHPERRHRFERESHAVARLNHPHICTLYDVGNQDGVEFLVMEYLEGETLSARLTRGPLPIDESLRHATALAQAIARAHQERIVHRDIKPSNVMLTESGAKLLDFGLAKLRGPEASPLLGTLSDSPTDDAISHEGTIVGTYAYMAPEQLQGRAVDGRTDIYALGLLIYEMITGQRAFTKSSQAALIAAILTEDPPLMSALQPRTPASVERIVHTCLIKDPEARWQDARDLARELASAQAGSNTTATAAAAARPIRRQRAMMIATAALAVVATIGVATVVWRGAGSREARNLVVLPCRAIGGDAQTQAYCDGLAETLSAKLMPLTASHGLQITSTLEARQKHVANAADALGEFGATLVFEGSVFRSGDTLRVNYIIVDARTSTQVDAYSTTASASDPFTVQDRVAQWAVGALALQLNQPERQALTAHGTSMPDAYEFYLQGRGYLLDPETPARVDAAIELFERALERDTHFALAKAGVGRAYWLKYLATKDPQWVDRGRLACEESVTLDPALTDAYVCLGTLKDGVGKYTEAAAEFQHALDGDPTSDDAYRGLAHAEEELGDFPAAERTYKRAIALRPQYWPGHTWIATFYRNRGRFAEAAEEYRQAVLLTPDNPKAYSDLGTVEILLGRYLEAIDAFNRSIALAPTYSAYSNLGITLFRMRRFDAAIQAFEKAQALRPGEYRVIGSLARAYYWKGDRERARDLYHEALERARTDLGVNPRDVDAHILLADYHAKLGDRRDALEELARAGDVSNNPHLLLFEAFVYNQLGDRARALEALERAGAGGLPVAELHAWVELDALRDEPRFRALLNQK